MKYTLKRNLIEIIFYLKVYDVRGREISTLVNSPPNAGSHTFMFDASGLTSGVYFYTLQTNNFSKTKKMMIKK
ncbi:MAG: T9SS type A sorting domain-containing protein [Ignavibacteria bacterium]|nr:T9SS type A sorting domain-containing protein [Ignavibacteria bacterium]